MFCKIMLAWEMQPGVMHTPAEEDEEDEEEDEEEEDERTTTPRRRPIATAERR